jgi:pyruvate/2-oxoglutarate dehydrogenase complex dihydrolipoamide acyltransferase (E2) component
MATKVFMEALSPTMEEGRLVKWLKAEGDAVKNGDTLAEVETDKAIMELVARGEGILRKRMIEDGATAPVGTVIGVIAGADEDISAVAVAESGKPSEARPGGHPPSGEAKAPAEPKRDQSTAPPTTPTQPKPEKAEPAPASGARTRSSPLARRLAAERGIDLGSIGGSGPGGRIVKRDIESAPAPPLARAVELRSDVAVFFNNLGMALERTGHLQTAEQAYAAAIAADPSNQRAADNGERIAAVVKEPDLDPVDLAQLAAAFDGGIQPEGESTVATATRVAPPDAEVTADSTVAE